MVFPKVSTNLGYIRWGILIREMKVLLFLCKELVKLPFKILCAVLVTNVKKLLISIAMGTKKDH